MMIFPLRFMAEFKIKLLWSKHRVNEFVYNPKKDGDFTKIIGLCTFNQNLIHCHVLANNRYVITFWYQSFSEQSSVKNYESKMTLF